MISLFNKFWRNEEGLSVVETAILFPMLISLLMGVYDIGQGIIINQKTVMASQVIGDLVARYEVLDQATVDDIVTAGELSLEPYDRTPFGYDITSIEFDDAGDPLILWRETDNMQPDDVAVNSTVGLGVEGEGVIAVSVVYIYIPLFSNFFVESIPMNERAFLRGRRSATVTCLDCG